MKLEIERRPEMSLKALEKVYEIMDKITSLINEVGPFPCKKFDFSIDENAERQRVAELRRQILDHRNFYLSYLGDRYADGGLDSFHVFELYLERLPLHGPDDTFEKRFSYEGLRRMIQEDECLPEEFREKLLHLLNEQRHYYP